MDLLEQFIAKAKGKNQAVVLPEGGDARVLRAARRLVDEGIAAPVLLGTPAELAAAAGRAGVPLDGIGTVDPETSEKLDAYAESVPSPRAYGIDEGRWFESLPLMAEQALASGSPANNPRIPDVVEIVELYQRVWNAA